MKIAIPTANKELCSHFGHCEAFAIFTVDEGEIVSREDITPPVHEPGSHPAFLRDLGCNVVIAGGLGGRAQDLLHGYGISTVIGVQPMPLEKLVTCYVDGSLEAGDNRCDH